MKKKLSMSMLLVIILIMVLAATVMAVTHWRDSAQKIAPIASENGYFEDWRAEERVEMLQILSEAGVLQEDSRMQEVLDGKHPIEEAGVIATEIITTWSGRDEEMLTFQTISAELSGKPFSQWSAMDKAWLSEVMRENGIPGNEGITLPETEDINEESAIAIAKNAISETYGLSDGVLDSYSINTSFRTVSVEVYGVMYGDEPIWTFEATKQNEVGGQATSEAYSAALDRHGNVLGCSWSNPYGSWEYYTLLMKERGGAFYAWTHAEQAEFSGKLPGVITQALADGESVRETLIGMSALKFGIPTADAIPEAQAIEIAKNHVMNTYGATEGENGLPKLKPYTSFDITDPAKPIWRVKFLPFQSERDENLESIGYVVHIEGKNGDITHSANRSDTELTALDLL